MEERKKECKGCFEKKPVGEFYAHPGMADGRLSFCKECKKTEAATRYHMKMKLPAWRDKERARNRARMKGKRYRADTVKKAAGVAVGNAVRDGRLVPTSACERCGHDFRHFRREGHHEDYTKPLEVEWLCSLCHGEQHRRRGQ